MSGKLDMTTGAIQGSLRQILEDDRQLLSAEQRYSLMAAMESIEFLKRLSPGLKKAIEEHKQNGIDTKTFYNRKHRRANPNGTR